MVKGRVRGGGRVKVRDRGRVKGERLRVGRRGRLKGEKRMKG